MRQSGFQGVQTLIACLGWLAAISIFILWVFQRPSDEYIPKFARVPYEPFSRSAVAAIAEREWRLFGERVDDPGSSDRSWHHEALERQEGLWQRVGEYWWIGLGPHFPDRAWTGKHDERGNIFKPDENKHYAWSAAFISYVMRISGAGSRFPYSDNHADFIIAAHKATPSIRGFTAQRPEDYAPQMGDLVCFSRDRGKVSKFDDISTTHFRAHCAVVTKVEPGVISIIGGNVGDAVALTHVPTTAEGKLVKADGNPTDRHHSWFVIIAIPYNT